VPGRLSLIKRLCSTECMYRLPVHLLIGVDPLVDDPLVAVEYGAAHVGHPGVRLAVGPPHVPVQQATRLGLHAQSHLKNDRKHVNTL
jgi:hypothetical protein